MNRLDHIFNVDEFIAQKQKGKEKTELKWSENVMGEEFKANKFNPVSQKNYYTKFNNSLYNPDEFKKYWSRKKNIKGIYKEDLDKDGIIDYIALDNDGDVVGFNNQIILDKKNSLYPYQRKYYEQPEDYRSKYSLNQFLETQKNIKDYRDIEKSTKRRQNQLWYDLYVIFIKTEKLMNKLTPKQLESTAKKIYELGKYILKPKTLDSSSVKPLFKKALFKELYDNVIESFDGGFITVFNLTPETVLYMVENKFNGFKDFCINNDIFNPIRLTIEEVQKIYDYYRDVDEKTVPAYRKDNLIDNWYNQKLIEIDVSKQKPKPKPPRFTQLEGKYITNFDRYARKNKKLAKLQETFDLNKGGDE